MNKMSKLLGFKSVADPIKLFFLRFTFMLFSLSVLLHIEKKSLIVKWPSLAAKTEKFFVSEEKSFIGLAIVDCLNRDLVERPNFCVCSNKYRQEWIKSRRLAETDLSLTTVKMQHSPTKLKLNEANLIEMFRVILAYEIFSLLTLIGWKWTLGTGKHCFTLKCSFDLNETKAKLPHPVCVYVLCIPFSKY